MSATSPIEWLLGGATWNWLVGCSFASAGCRECYALGMTRRLAGSLGGPYAEAIRNGRWSGRVLLREDKLDEPARWRKGRLVFVNSMSDTFHEEVPDAWLDRAFTMMDAARNHTYLLVTKRARRMREYLTRRYPHGAPKHIWAGGSVCNQDDAERQAPEVMATPAAVRFLSCEPLVGPVDLSRWLWADLDGRGRARLNRIHWTIIGGESGARARRVEVAEIRSLLEQCRAAGVRAFMKQLGTAWAREQDGLPDPKGADPEEWDADLRVREMPEASR
jgi:protein gp37